MNTILIDTNVIIDLLSKREQFYIDSLNYSQWPTEVKFTWLSQL